MTGTTNLIGCGCGLTPHAPYPWNESGDPFCVMDAAYSCTEPPFGFDRLAWGLSLEVMAVKARPS